MKTLFFIALNTTAALAQPNAANLLTQSLLQGLSGVTPIPEQDRADVLKATTALLASHITIAPNGDASAVCHFSGNRPAEWKKFGIGNISKQALTEADGLNGITKRYLVSFTCSAHRNWDAKTNAWGEWKPIGNVLFPAAISLELKGGKWVVPNTQRLDYFTPVGGSPEPARPVQPDPSGLPPGMIRSR